MEHTRFRVMEIMNRTAEGICKSALQIWQGTGQLHAWPDSGSGCRLKANPIQVSHDFNVDRWGQDSQSLSRYWHLMAAEGRRAHFLQTWALRGFPVPTYGPTSMCILTALRIHAIRPEKSWWEFRRSWKRRDSRRVWSKLIIFLDEILKQ